MTWDNLPRFRTYGIDAYVSYVRTDQVVPGVICHVYRFAEAASRDLGIIEISSGSATPVQRIAVDGETAEGCLAGAGTLTTITAAGDVAEYAYPGAEPGPVTLGRGDRMFWQAAEAGLVVYEICTPPWTPDRFAGLFRQHL